MAENKVEFGLKNVKLGVVEEGQDGQITYGAPYAQKGATALTIDPAGSTTTFYADDIAYYIVNANQGYTGTVTFAKIDEWVLMNGLGFKKDAKGVLYEPSDAQGKTLYMLFEGDGDVHKVRHCFYRVRLARPSIGKTTKGESVEVGTQALNITVTPIPETMVVKASTTPDTTQERYDNWYTTVEEPSGEFSAVTTLATLTIGSLTLSPAFKADTKAYTATTTQASDVVTAESTEPNAKTTVIVNGEEHNNGSAATWNDGANNVTVNVQNGGAIGTYTVTVTKS